MNEVCGGCHPNEPRPECVGAFARRRILKVHWECWSDCNLHCRFCFRMRGPPLDTTAGKYLVRAVKSSGARGIAFVGGDPSLRPDIAELINDARNLGLWIEVQTNGHQQPEPFLSALLSVNSVGVSLDGPDPETHDRFRDQPGNFDRVTSLLRFLQRHGIPVVVRSIVALHNHKNLVGLAAVLSRFGNVVRWVLMEFVPVGEGYANREEYLLDRNSFSGIVSQARALADARLTVDTYYRENHSGTYGLLPLTAECMELPRTAFRSV